MTERAGGDLRFGGERGECPVRLVERERGKRGQSFHFPQGLEPSANLRAVALLPAFHQVERVKIPQEKPLSQRAGGRGANRREAGERFERVHRLGGSL